MAALTVLAIVAVGCGGGDKNGSGAAKVTGVQAGTGSRRDEAAEAGKKAAEATEDGFVCSPPGTTD